MEGWKQACREICAAKGEPPCWKLIENCEPCEDCKVVGVVIDELRKKIDALKAPTGTILDDAKSVLDHQTAKGVRKYGGPLDITRPGSEALLEHAIEEAADLLLYLTGLRRALAEEDDGCPVGDPDCMGNNGDCHDACEPPSPERTGDGDG